MKWTIFRPKTSTPSVRSFYVSQFHLKLRPSGVSLESRGLENIPQLPANRAKVAQNHNARKAFSAALSVLKESRAIFRPRSSTPSVRSFQLCQVHWKLRQSGVSFESPGLKTILEVPANRAKVSQSYDARKALSSTRSVLKWSGAIFRPRNSTPSVRSLYLCPFYRKTRPSGVSLESPVLENIPQISENRAKVRENNHARQAVSSPVSVLKCSGPIFRPRRSTPSVRSF